MYIGIGADRKRGFDLLKLDSCCQQNRKLGEIPLREILYDIATFIYICQHRTKYKKNRFNIVSLLLFDKKVFDVFQLCQVCDFIVFSKVGLPTQKPSH